MCGRQGVLADDCGEKRINSVGMFLAKNRFDENRKAAKISAESRGKAHSIQWPVNVNTANELGHIAVKHNRSWEVVKSAGNSMLFLTYQLVIASGCVRECETPQDTQMAASELVAFIMLSSITFRVNRISASWSN